ncbi:peptidase m24 [Moniliophthora roreri MCA 2997]|uniref:Peptidase m24 n=1 Tax=Moniliophthora roreri (strain MCA 2997) TaxID=1381753 RepID=V2XJ94_MONRO|nr:peptidase m24 [Moniliophthora roreri MCA 2997]
MEKLQTKVDGSKPSSLKSVLLALFILVGWFIVPLNPWLDSRHPSSSPGFPSLENHCADRKPIQASEFHGRQKALVETLRTLNASAYITEPGANALYYANVSSSYWHLSERPLLVAITPKVQADGTVEPQLVVLAPKFEAARANLLDIPFDNIRYEYWPEEANPYQILVSALSISEGKIFVDGSIRHFIVDGLQAAYGQGSVVSAPQEVNRLRERKSAAERELLKCANEATLLALRAVHKKMYIGMRESEAGNMMASALTAVGLQNGECLTLFGENAALPHGGGTDRELGESDFALFDCKGTLHEYWSDLTRTVALPDTVISVEASKIWQLVRIAQNSALSEARKGVVAKSVDEAARRALSVFGYAKYFTHRLGHGIGLEVHEGPYLNGGSEDILDTGHTFSDEPGIYIEGKIGVRLEDCFYIDEQSGSAVLFTEGVGGQAKSVLEP